MSVRPVLLLTGQSFIGEFYIAVAKFPHVYTGRRTKWPLPAYPIFGWAGPDAACAALIQIPPQCPGNRFMFLHQIIEEIGSARILVFIITVVHTFA